MGIVRGMGSLEASGEASAVPARVTAMLSENRYLDSAEVVKA
jgi:hypothetical protein